MNIQEAYKILESPTSISEEDLKKKYKNLARKYHPDVYKDDPNKFKQINEAYQFIKDYKKEQQHSQQGFPTDFEEIFSNFGFGRQNRGPTPRSVDNILLNEEITFEESVLGTEKEIEIEREIKCENCNGEGFYRKKNGCTHCDGYGKSTITRGNMTFTTMCRECHGQSTKEECAKCNKKCYIKNKTKLKVKIPPGIQDKNIIQLQGAGHFSHSSIFGDAYSNVLINISVKNNTELKLDGNDVIFNLNISLLEALEGCSKEVQSIKGSRTVEIPSGSRNKEEIIIPNLGVNLVGNERVILHVNYPENKEKLISVLKEGI